MPIYELSKSSLYSEFINAQAGLPFTSKNFDMDEWARSMALHDLFGSYHGSVPKSVRFYFNPVIGKYQPLLFDIHIGAGNWKKFVVLDFILQPNLSSCEWLCDYKKFYLGFLKNKDFLDSYVMYLEKYSSPEFINKVKFIFDSKFKKLNHEFYATFSPSDDIFNRGNSLYLFKFGPIQKKGKVIRDRIKLYKDRDPIITGEDGKNFKYELNQFELIFDSEVQVSNLNNFEMKGSKWNLNEKSIYIFSGNTVLTGISKDEPLVIAGPAMFVQNGGTILMDNVVLSSLNELNVSNRNWSGAFNIFDSDAKIENLTIKNVSAEDAINFVNSTYRIGLLKIDGARSDGLDSDFSTGTIENIDCKFIGNDCLDISETKVSLLNANIVDVLDKGISAGENSNISVENLKLTNTGIGVVSKDGSILKVKNISFKNVDLPIAVFNKKPSYADPTIDIVNVLSDEDLFSYISENATISMPTYIKTEVYSSEEIEGLMYGTVYGVATEKK